MGAGHPVPAHILWYHIFSPKMNYVTALGMLSHQPGPVLFLFGWASPAVRCYYFFGWHQARGQYLFFDHGRDFIFHGFHA